MRAAFRRLVAELQCELGARVQPGLRPELAEQQAVRPAWEAPEELQRASQQPQALRASAEERLQLLSSA